MKRTARTATSGPRAGAEEMPEPASIPPWLWVAGLAGLVVSRVACWVLLPRATEDAYIAFRYARNLVAGLGLTFNPGERVLGFTSAPWTLWCALGIRIGVDPVVWTRLTALAADAVTLLAACAILARFVSRSAAICFAAFFAVWPFFGVAAVSGMETSAMLATMALAGWQIAQRRGNAGFALGVLALMRPEGLFMAAVMSVWTSWRERAWTAAIIVVGMAGLWLYFGTPVPQSLTAKAAVYGTPGPWEGRVWWDWIFPLELGRWPALQEPLQLWPYRVLLAPAAALALWKWRRSRALAFVAGGLTMWAGYVVLGVAYFYWYFHVPAATFAWLACAGLPEIVRGRWVYLTLGLMLVGSWTLQPSRIYLARARAEEALFLPVARHLATNARPGDHVVLEPLGLIGWMNPSLVLHDEVGLVAASAMRAREGGAGWYGRMLREDSPRWVVVRYALLSSGQAFTGALAPFRDSADAAATLAPYRLAFPTSRQPGATDLVVLERGP